MNTPSLKMLTDEQLLKLNTKRLLGVLKSVRALESAEQRRLMIPHVCCEECMEWMLDDEAWKELVINPTAYLTSYKNKIKSILSTRKHC